MKKMTDEFVMKHKTNMVNLFRQTQKTNKNLSISTTSTSNSQNKPNEKLNKKNSSVLNDINEKNNNELNDTLLEEYLETEGKRLLNKLSESVQTTKNGHIIINSKKLLNRNDSKENGAFVFDRLLSHPNKTKITKKTSINSNVILTMHKKQMSVMFSPPIKKKPTMSSNTSNNITLRSSNTTNTNSNNTKRTMKKKSSLLLNNLTNTNNISYNEKIAYLINNTDNSIVPQIKKVVHMKATSVANNKTNSSNRLTPTNKKEKKRNISGSFNVSNMNKIKNPKKSRTQLISALY